MIRFGCPEGGGRRLALLLPFFLLALAGCGNLFAGLFGERAGPERVVLNDVPFFPQDDLQCGPASLAMLLAWSGNAVSPVLLAEQVYSPSLRGSLQPSLVAAARRHGRLAHVVTGREALLAELAAGHPVLILQNLGLSWFPRWHYAVVIGYDRVAARVFLHSGPDRNLSLPARVFANTWERSGFWGLLVLPPGRLPATATEESHLASVVGLERSGQAAAAALAYDAALARWPGNFLAWMGLGNSRFALGDAAAAEVAFRQALELRGDDGPALNNLALALAAMGRRQEALAVIARAVELGGELQEEFLRTREEILDGGGGDAGGMTPGLPE